MVVAAGTPLEEDVAEGAEQHTEREDQHHRKGVRRCLVVLALLVEVGLELGVDRAEAAQRLRQAPLKRGLERRALPLPLGEEQGHAQVPPAPRQPALLGDRGPLVSLARRRPRLSGRERALEAHPGVLVALEQIPVAGHDVAEQTTLLVQHRDQHLVCRLGLREGTVGCGALVAADQPDGSGDDRNRPEHEQPDTDVPVHRYCIDAARRRLESGFGGPGGRVLDIAVAVG
jgi:hypothetical protein